MNLTTKTILAGLIPIALFGATIVKLSSIRDTSTTGSSTAANVLVVLPNGQLIRGKSSQITVDSVGNIVVQSLSAPSISVTTITAGVANSFPIPNGKTVCDVSLNIPQSPGVDFNISGGNIVFVTPPEVGDVLKLLCF